MISVTKKYMLWTRSIYKKSTGSAYFLEGAPLNAVVTAIDDQIENGRQLVEYGKYRGWVEVDYLEPYAETLEKDCVYLADMQTPEDDAQQYVRYNGKRIVNACGMISIAYLMGLPLSEVIEKWKLGNPSHFGIIDRGGWLTTADDLMVILATVGRASERLRLKRYAPSLLTGKEIVAVTIDKITGRLSTSGVRHWVVPVSVQPDRIGYGTIDIYNPFPNRRERYSWSEFMQSSKLVNGVKI